MIHCRQIREAATYALTETVGRGKAYKPEEIAQVVGVHKRSVYCWLRGDGDITGYVLTLQLYFPAFMTAYSAALGYTVVAAAEEEGCYMAASQALLDAVPETGKAMSDGRYDHMEKHKIWKHWWPVLAKMAAAMKTKFKPRRAAA